MLDRRTLRPLDAHFLEEGLPVLAFTLFLLARLPARVVVRAKATHRLDFLVRVVDTLDEGFRDVVLAGDEFGRRHVKRHHHHDLTANDELVANRVADKLQRLMERDVARRNRLDRLQAVRRRGRIFVTARREVIGLLGRRLLLDRTGRRTENEVEATLLGRDVGTIIVLRRLAEELDRVNDRGRRLERDVGKFHLFHAALDILLHRALGIVARLSLHRFGRLGIQLRGINRIHGTPRLVDISNHAVSGRLTLLLQNRLPFLLDGLADANCLLVVRVVLQYNLALF